MLDLAEYMMDKILKVDNYSKHFIINYYQIKARKENLLDSDKEWLHKMKDNEKNNAILCAINILLKNTYDAKMNFGYMELEEQEVFKKFPIYTLYDKLY